MSAHRPRKRFGQNFLIDRNIVRRIVEAIAPSTTDHLVEIGPGEGALTSLLLERVPHLDAIEIDRDLHASLAQRFPADRLRLHLGDALAFDYSCLPMPLRVVGNLPYNISTPLLFHLAGFASRCVDMHFMLQQEVVARMVARHDTPDYGRLSVMLQSRFEMRRLFGVPPTAFRPIPKVRSAIVRLRPLPDDERRVLGVDVEPVLFAQVVTRAFSQRRKTLRNALSGLIDTESLLRIGIDPGCRAETLAVRQFAAIAIAVAHAKATDPTGDGTTTDAR